MALPLVRFVCFRIYNCQYLAAVRQNLTSQILPHLVAVIRSMCPRSRDCPVLPHLQPCVSALHRSTRIRLLHAEDLPPIAATKLQCAAHISNRVQTALAYDLLTILIRFGFCDRSRSRFSLDLPLRNYLLPPTRTNQPNQTCLIYIPLHEPQISYVQSYALFVRNSRLL